jgi:hypothetical protein
MKVLRQAGGVLTWKRGCIVGGRIGDCGLGAWTLAPQSLVLAAAPDNTDTDTVAAAAGPAARRWQNQWRQNGQLHTQTKGWCDL